MNELALFWVYIVIIGILRLVWIDTGVLDRIAGYNIVGFVLVLSALSKIYNNTKHQEEE